MITIYKFEIPSSTGRVQMPRGAKILTVGVQRDMPQVWALVDTTAPMVQRRLVAVPTGGGMPAGDATDVTGGAVLAAVPGAKEGVARIGTLIRGTNGRVLETSIVVRRENAPGLAAVAFRRPM